MPIGFSIWGPPVIGAAASAGFGKLFGGKGGGPTGISKTSPTFRRAEQLGDLSKEFAFDYALPEGKKLLGEAESTLQKPLDYYSALLSGDRPEMMAAIAPEAGIIGDQYAQAKKNIGQFTPRGGGQTALLSELPFQQGRDVQTLLQRIRPEAAQQLQNIAGEQGRLSGMVTGEGLQAGQLGLNAITEQINALLGKASQEIPLQQEIGGGLYQMLNKLIGQGFGGVGGADLPGEIGGIPGDLGNIFNPLPGTELPAPIIGGGSLGGGDIGY